MITTQSSTKVDSNQGFFSLSLNWTLVLSYLVGFSGLGFCDFIQVYKAIGSKCSEQILEVMFLSHFCYNHLPCIPV